MPPTCLLPVLREGSLSDLESLPQWRPSEQCMEVFVCDVRCRPVATVCLSVCLHASLFFYVCMCVCLQFLPVCAPSIHSTFPGKVLQGVSGLLILARGELWWRSLLLMSGLAGAARRAGTSLARLPPLMSSLLSIVLFHPCFPRAIQPAQMILFSFSAVSIILLNLLLSQTQAWVFAGLLFQLTQALVVNIDWG